MSVPVWAARIAGCSSCLTSMPPTLDFASLSISPHPPSDAQWTKMAGMAHSYKRRYVVVMPHRPAPGQVSPTHLGPDPLSYLDLDLNKDPARFECESEPTHASLCAFACRPSPCLQLNLNVNPTPRTPACVPLPADPLLASTE